MGLPKIPLVDQPTEQLIDPVSRRAHTFQPFSARFPVSDLPQQSLDDERIQSRRLECFVAPETHVTCAASLRNGLSEVRQQKMATACRRRGKTDHLVELRFRSFAGGTHLVAVDRKAGACGHIKRRHALPDPEESNPGNWQPCRYSMPFNKCSRGEPRPASKYPGIYLPPIRKSPRVHRSQQRLDKLR